MQNTATVINSAVGAAQKVVNGTAFSPRFYTTDFDAMNRICIEPVRPAWDAMMAAYESDNNRNYFQRDASFADELHQCDAKMSPELKQEMLDFLITTLTSELSGCILYNEIKRNVSNPDIKRLMGYMARDEARHASFINASLKDYGLGINMGEIKRKKRYTYFKPKYIFYATYLSEKIGYARYIKIFRQLEAAPEKRFHPIFRWFRQWCDDEFRHGESIALILRANPALLKGHNLLLIRFFLLAVYGTMYVRDHMRPALKQAMGLHPTEYDFEVFRITNQIIRQCLPILPDLDNPAFKSNLERLSYCAQRANRATTSGGLFGKLGKAFWSLAGAAVFARLYCIPMRSNSLPEVALLQPAW
jgi:magnesium-protoporphyrin IX monomethyl ester (oxidative) cyclase